MNTDRELIIALRDTPDGTALPAEGVFQPLYMAFEDVGNFRVADDGAEPLLLCLAPEETAADVRRVTPGWHIDVGERDIELTMIIPIDDIPETVRFRFGRAGDATRSLLRHLRNTGTVTIAFLYLLYGELHKGSIMTFAVPPEVAQTPPTE